MPNPFSLLSVLLNIGIYTISTQLAPQSFYRNVVPALQFFISAQDFIRQCLQSKSSFWSSPHPLLACLCWLFCNKWTPFSLKKVCLLKLIRILAAELMIYTGCKCMFYYFYTGFIGGFYLVYRHFGAHLLHEEPFLADACVINSTLSSPQLQSGPWFSCSYLNTFIPCLSHSF